jgi:hypothetical protein
MKNECLIGTRKKLEKCAYFDPKNQILSIVKVMHVVWFDLPIKGQLMGEIQLFLWFTLSEIKIWSLVTHN